MVTQFDKALIALITPLILAGLSAAGVTPEMTVGEAVPLIIGAVIVAFMVWLVPNRKVQ